MPSLINFLFAGSLCVGDFSYLCSLMDDLLPIDLPASPLVPERIVIAGPCSAESEEGVEACALAIAGLGIGGAFRAGAWKPRTQPGSFEGYGVPALGWIRRAGMKAAMPVGTEVATPDHVREAVSAGIDFLWIGARTATNPFAMQELAEALGRECPQKVVLVKNPLNPDIELWVGALRRLYLAGVRRLGAIHRGFSVYNSEPYRNAPLWQIPLQLHRRFPNLPLLHDPSHTGGRRDLIAPLSQSALDLGFDGLMIECHQHPDRAMSDGGQQVTAAELAEILSGLRVRSGSGSGEGLAALRMQIDDIDGEMISLLARRMELTDSIGDYKRRSDMPVLQPDRYSRLLRALMQRGREHGLNPDFLRRLLESIHEESVRRQLDIINPARLQH